MIGENKKYVQLTYLLALIPIGIAVGFLLGLLEAPLRAIDSTTLLLASMGTGIMYGVAIYLTRSVKARMWLGYIHMAIAIALFTVGIANALYILILASLFVSIIQQQNLRPSTNTSLNFRVFSEWVSLSGLTVLVEYFVYNEYIQSIFTFL